MTKVGEDTAAKLLELLNQLNKATNAVEDFVTNHGLKPDGDTESSLEEISFLVGTLALSGFNVKTDSVSSPENKELTDL